ncbi:MAG: zinc-dependent peptidase [Bacteroidota bacterium]
MSSPLYIFGILFVFLVVLWNRLKSKGWKEPKSVFPPGWRIILVEKVVFYNSLTANEKELFEFKIQEFLINVRITGIRTGVSEEDMVLIASSAVIPIFSFPEWKYLNLNEVLLYPKSFDLNFNTKSNKIHVLGVVGDGFLEGKMALSKKALHLGFENESDKRNTAIHEFVHLIDKLDGNVDGLPALLMEKQYVLPWLDLINTKINDIRSNKSDIRDYGATNQQEFFAVASEYFFERPKLLSQKHPELYSNLEQIFRHDTKGRNFKRTNSRIGRNDKCPCGSGLKFKHCCGKVHYS